MTFFSLSPSSAFLTCIGFLAVYHSVHQTDESTFRESAVNLLSPHESTTVIPGVRLMGRLKRALEHDGSPHEKPPDLQKRAPAQLSELIDEKLRSKLPPCSHSKAGRQNFLMVFMDHRASSAILSELAQHSHIFVPVPEPLDHPPYEFNSEFGLKYADEFFNNASTAGKVAGFKIRPWHILRSPSKWRALVLKHNIRVIWQYRENIFKQAVGEYTAVYSNDSSAIERIGRSMSQGEPCRVGVGCRFTLYDMRKLHEFMLRFWENDETIRNAVHLVADFQDDTICALPVPYEEYAYERKLTMRKLHMFLGVPSEDHLPFRQKAAGDNMCETILNFQEVICPAFFGCSIWRPMLRDGKNRCSCHEVRRGYLSHSNAFCSLGRVV